MASELKQQDASLLPEPFPVRLDHRARGVLGIEKQRIAAAGLLAVAAVVRWSDDTRVTADPENHVPEPGD